MFSNQRSFQLKECRAKIIIPKRYVTWLSHFSDITRFFRTVILKSATDRDGISKNLSM